MIITCKGQYDDSHVDQIFKNDKKVYRYLNAIQATKALSKFINQNKKEKLKHMYNLGNNDQFKKFEEIFKEYMNKTE
jgi:hypothetical protein